MENLGEVVFLEKTIYKFQLAPNGAKFDLHPPNMSSMSSKASPLRGDPKQNLPLVLEVA